MAKKYIFLRGKAKWANRLFIADQKYKCWSVVLYPDEESYSKVLEMKKGSEGVQGILNMIKKDEDGYNITLKRPTEKLIKGKLTAFLPPVVLNADNTPFNPQGPQIGNLSDVICKVDYYTFSRPTGGKGSAIRLESVRIEHLIPFNKETDFAKADAEQVSGLTEQPPPLF